MARRYVPVAALTAVLLSAIASAQESWPRFRGPHADGVAPDHAGLPTKWTATENVKWVADVPGWGWSCPIVWGDRAFLTSVVSDEPNVAPAMGLYLGERVREPAQGMHHWLAYCFDLNTGKELWKHEAHAGRPRDPIVDRRTRGDRTQSGANQGNASSNCDTTARPTAPGERELAERLAPVVANTIAATRANAETQARVDHLAQGANVGQLTAGEVLGADILNRQQDSTRPSTTYVDGGLAENSAEKDGRRVPKRAEDCRS